MLLVTRKNMLAPAVTSVAPALAAHFMRSKWLLEVEWNKKLDQNNYSDLLGNVPRHISRASGRLEWQANLTQAPRWQVQAGVQWTRQKSNLQLFKLDSYGPYLGLTHSW